MPEQRTTLETLARILGVSKMTVSNAYNRPDQLSPALRQRVLDTARELGYPGPNPVASTLRRGRSGTLGLAFDDPLSYAFTDPAAIVFMRGIAGECEGAGVGLLLVPGSPRRAETLNLVRHAMVDAFAVFCDHEGDERIDVLRERGLPFVLIDSPHVPDVPAVGIDDRGGARQAAQHLIELGHRRFGVLSCCLSPDTLEGRMDLDWEQQAGYFVTKERLRGYREAIQAAGIAWDGVAIYQHAGVEDPEANAGGDGEGRLAGRLLDQAERPTAILAMSDELARGALRAAAARGIRVPAELSVVGFDDTPEAVRDQPALTTVHQPLAEKGAMAVRLLLSPEIDPQMRIELPTRLVVRASTAPAPRLNPTGVRETV
jgi:DNA-binding LacI/PurR family transcriptional regulator